MVPAPASVTEPVNVGAGASKVVMLTFEISWMSYAPPVEAANPKVTRDGIGDGNGAFVMTGVKSSPAPVKSTLTEYVPSAASIWTCT
jgi:hypothetical protein